MFSRAFERMRNARTHRAINGDDLVDVSESNGVRMLHLGSITVQSAMRIKDPFALELAYTRGMMCFLLFSKQADSVLMIGLGGGSLAKYVHKYLPEMMTKVIEINPQIIQVAHSHFNLPEDDTRLEVLETDGLLYLQQNPASSQVLMIDAFDQHGIPTDFCSQDFFDSCAKTLSDDGMLVINLWGSDKNFDIYLQRIEHSFANNTLILPTGKPGNIVVFGFRRAPTDLRVASLRERAKILEKTHEIEFLQFVEKLQTHNNSTHHRSLLERNA